MISVIATIQTKPGKLDEFLEAFQAIVSEVRAEQGCIEYFPATNVDAGIDVQTPLPPDSMMVIEKWQSPAALTAHLSAAHMNAFRQRTANLVEAVTIHVVEPRS